METRGYVILQVAARTVVGTMALSPCGGAVQARRIVDVRGRHGVNHFSAVSIALSAPESVWMDALHRKARVTKSVPRSPTQGAYDYLMVWLT